MAAGSRPAVRASVPLPLEEVPAAVRERVRKVVEHPTLSTRGPVEAFVCQPQTYHWLLEHPDRAVAAWRRLGATVTDVTDRGNGRFGWSDGAGSDIHWDTVASNGKMRVWFAEGRVCPGLPLPALPVQAVVVIRYAESRDGSDRPVLRHQAELFVRTDSKAAALATRLLGDTAPRLAEQYVVQLETFFSALAVYLNQHPDQAPRLLAVQR
jgi:hypothetical protein